MVLNVLTWNLFHGRDFPPDPTLRTWRSRLLRISERNESHAQVNRDLLDEFAAVLAAAQWDVALLQETPPRWHAELAARCDAEAHAVLTARNSFGSVRSFLARLNPDLIASNEGGSNLTLVRGPCSIRERRELELHRARWAERRMMAFTRLALPGGAGLSVANVHLSAGRARQGLAEEELRLAAVHAIEWSGATPLVLGGDINIRPAETAVFNELSDRYGLTGVTAANALDHLLSRGLEIEEPGRRWPPERREVREQGRAIRLSDHAPVSARLRAERPGGSR